jgi:hypothetical protein
MMRKKLARQESQPAAAKRRRRAPSRCPRVRAWRPDWSGAIEQLEERRLLAIDCDASPASAVDPATASPAQQQSVQQQYGQLPLSFETRSFEANHGESDSQVTFLARGAGDSLFLTDSGAVFDLRRSAARTTATCHSIAWETRMQTQPALA